MRFSWQCRVSRVGVGPVTAVVTAFIDDYHEGFGVELICRVLTEHGATIAPCTYVRLLGCLRPVPVGARGLW